MEEKQVGKVTHYYGKIRVAIVELSDTLGVGDQIHIKGASTDFNQRVESIEVEHQKVEQGKPGESIGLKVEGKVREGDIVYKIIA